MRDRIIQISKGNVDVKAADIVCYPSEFHQTISSDYTQKFDVYLQSRNHVSMKTLIFSTDHRVVPVEKSVVGEKATVHFEVLCNPAEVQKVNNFLDSLDF